MIRLKKSIPALPVVDMAKAVEFYQSKMGFRARHQEREFAIVVRDTVEVHLWQACDKRWKFRLWWIFQPILSGAESFLAGTASCRVQVEDVDGLFLEYKGTGVLFDKNTTVVDQPWGDRDFAVLDLYGNLITFCQVG